MALREREDYSSAEDQQSYDSEAQEEPLFTLQPAPHEIQAPLYTIYEGGSSVSSGGCRCCSSCRKYDKSHREPYEACQTLNSRLSTLRSGG